MPDFRKSYKKSKNSKNSKSGGRRRKHTMRKYRRGRKVMRGGINEYTNRFPGGSNLVAYILTNDESITDKNRLEDYVYNPTFNVKSAYIDLFGNDPPKDKSNDDNRDAIVNYLDSGGSIKPQ